MSVINQMLQDLDQRRAESERGALPPVVQRVPPARGRRHWPWLVLCLLLVIGAGAGAWWQWGGEMARATALPLPPSPPAVAAAAAAVIPPMPTLAITVSPPSLAAPAAPVAVHAGVEEGLRLAQELTLPAANHGGAAESRSGDKVAPRPVVRESKAPPAAKVAEAPVAPVGMPSRIDKQSRQGNARDQAESEYRNGVNALTQGRTQEGVGFLRQALREDGGHGAARQLLLKILVEQHSLDEARQLLSDGLALQPRQSGWSMALARLQLDGGDLKGAWQTLEAGLPYAGDSVDYHAFAGALLQRQQRYREAADQYRSALRLQPADGRWWIGLGLALEADGNVPDARQAYQNARASTGLAGEMRTFVEQKLR